MKAAQKQPLELFMVCICLPQMSFPLVQLGLIRLSIVRHVGQEQDV